MKMETMDYINLRSNAVWQFQTNEQLPDDGQDGHFNFNTVLI
jgi:hypothetical protein